jgi:hypothetical protein
MGCDIHSVIQVRGYDKKWRTVCWRPGDDRNYDTFAVYADVRNGHGFAGVPTGEGWKPIDQPRGYPEDFQVDEDQHGNEPDEYGEGKGQWMGDHSHSWLTLAEMEAKWSELQGAFYEVVGVVERKHFEQTVAKGVMPREYCGGISGRNIVQVAEEAVAAGTAPKDWTHVSHRWKVPATDRLSTMKDHMTIMRILQCYGKPEDVRIVFGFDS